MNLIGQQNFEPFLKNSNKHIIIEGGRRMGKKHMARCAAEYYGLQYTPLESKAKVVRELTKNYEDRALYHLADIGNSPKIVQSLLLKVLEDTPADKCRFVITTPTPLLDTIYSRCDRYHVSPYTADELGIEQSALWQYNNSPSKINSLPDNIDELEGYATALCMTSISLKELYAVAGNYDLWFMLLVRKLNGIAKYELVRNLVYMNDEMSKQGVINDEIKIRYVWYEVQNELNRL